MATNGARLADLRSPNNKVDRSSFSSVREDDLGLAQSFTSSKISSFSHLHLASDSSSDEAEAQAQAQAQPQADTDTEAAITDDEDDDESLPSLKLPGPDSTTASIKHQPASSMATTTLTSTTHFRTPLTQPHSRLHGCWVPAVAADSFQGWKAIDVKGKLASRSFGDLQSLKVVWSAPSTPKKPRSPGRSAPGTAPIERLPIEILGTSSYLLLAHSAGANPDHRSYHRAASAGRAY